MFFFYRYKSEVFTGSSWFLLSIFSISIYSFPIPIPAGVDARPGLNPAAHPESCHAMGQSEMLRAGSRGPNLKTTSITEVAPSDARGMLSALRPTLPLCHAEETVVPGTPRCSIPPARTGTSHAASEGKIPPGTHSSQLGSTSPKSQKINSHLYAQSTSL